MSVLLAMAYGGLTQVWLTRFRKFHELAALVTTIGFLAVVHLVTGYVAQVNT